MKNRFARRQKFSPCPPMLLQLYIQRVAFLVERLHFRSICSILFSKKVCLRDLFEVNNYGNILFITSITCISTLMVSVSFKIFQIQVKAMTLKEKRLPDQNVTRTLYTPSFHYTLQRLQKILLLPDRFIEYTYTLLSNQLGCTR